MLPQNRLRSLALKQVSLLNNQQSLMKYGSYLKKFSINEVNSITPLISTVRTLKQQIPLAPRMPVPKLDNSVNKFLKAAKPLLNDNEYDTSKKNAFDFIKEGGVGEKLQNLLQEKANKTENWLSDWWLDKVYLDPRYSLIISCNPASLYPKANYETVEQQLEFATKYIQGFLEFKKYIEENKLPVDKMGNNPMCMDQFYKILASCRVPNKNKDDFKIVNSRNIDIKKSNHVTVMYNNRIFKLKIVDPLTGQNISSSDIFTNLKNLVETVNEKGLGLGIMTSAHRDSWYEVYSELSKNEINQKYFESIQNSLFVLCLDGETKTEDYADSRSAACNQMLHGNKEYTPNRWFDKTIQIIIGPNGVWGTNFEHTVGEAGPHSLMNDFIYKNILSNQDKINYNELLKCETNELKFEIPEDVQEAISYSSLLTNKLIENLDLVVLSFDIFGKNFPKSQKMSPDAFVQLAMQLAFYRTHETLGNSYESGSLRKFHLGRTDVIRTCSSDTAEFVRAMLIKDASNTDKGNLFIKAIKSHSQFTQSIMNFESFDRHLFGLKQIALENKIDLPDLYSDMAFKKLNHFYISSSQISSKFDAVTCYGPLVEDGYGCSYNIMEHKLMFGISATKSCTTTSAQVFRDNLNQSLLDCQNLLLKVNTRHSLSKL